MVNKPLLPPSAGYVEIVNENGEHVYSPTRETIEKRKTQEQIEAQRKLISEQEEIINRLLGTTEGDVNE